MHKDFESSEALLETNECVVILLLMYLQLHCGAPSPCSAASMAALHSHSSPGSSRRSRSISSSLPERRRTVQPNSAGFFERNQFCAHRTKPAASSTSTPPGTEPMRRWNDGFLRPPAEGDFLFPPPFFFFVFAQLCNWGM